MRWYELCENPWVMTSRYSEPPDLNPFKIRETYLCFGQMVIYGELPFPPDQPREPEPFSVGAIALQFWPIKDLHCDNDPIDKIGCLELEKLAENQHLMTFTAEDSQMTARFGSVMIEGISVLSPNRVEANQRSLFSYPNVWNSCLRILRSMGFELELVGSPAPDDSPNYCQWHARKDDLTLKAPNPIELMGLAGVSERTTKDVTRTYWWVVDGDDIVQELTDAWQAKYFPQTPLRGLEFRK